MILSSWLKDFIDTPLTPREAAHVLTMSGSNIEAVHGDALEVEVTPMVVSKPPAEALWAVVLVAPLVCLIMQH